MGQPPVVTSVDYPVTGASQPQLATMDILKPYLLLACVAFTFGFVGYWAMARALAPSYDTVQDSYSYEGPITTSAPEPVLADGKLI